MRLPKSFHNWTSYAGTAIASLSFAVFLFLFVFHTLSEPNRVPYAGLVIFILVPAFILFGLILIPLGMFLEWLHWRRTGERSIPRLPEIDLNRTGHRNGAFLFLVGTIVLLFFSAYGGYRAYQYTESVAFCGQLCHAVMKPEFTTYRNSPHARVKCVECHVGPGATWYVRSKLSGLYQVYATVRDKYPRPIPGTITDLRPAREVCEQCHWPKAFRGRKEVPKAYYLSDRENSAWNLRLLLKLGGQTLRTATAEGIHWHVDPNVRIQYIATDEERQTIPWVKVTYLNSGNSKEFNSADNSLSEEERSKSEPRTMDCMDCHNRPTHRLASPVSAMNEALASGRISVKIPYIKREGVSILSKQYPSTDAALEGIEKGIRDFYDDDRLEDAPVSENEIAQAIEALKHIYQQNFFPGMEARWSVYPSNVGHWIFPGCRRCHDGQHQASDGSPIPSSCDTCHLILSQGKPGSEAYMSTAQGLTFDHPSPIGGLWQQTPCTECHTGGSG